MPADRDAEGARTAVDPPSPGASSAGAAAAAAPGAAAEPPAPEAPDGRLSVEVVWGDIRFVPKGDVYLAGHYIDVVPQYAEEALDEMISAYELRWEKGDDDGEGERIQIKRAGRVLHGLTLRGSLRGALGDVSLFPMAPWSAARLAELTRDDGDDGAAADRETPVIAIAGMGHMGSFGAYELRRLGQSVASTISRLPGRRHVCSVLIGSGVGNLSIERAVERLTTGILQGTQESAGSRGMTLSLVERSLGRAHRIQRALATLSAKRPKDLHLLHGEPRPSREGRIDRHDSLALAVASMAAAAVAPESSPLRTALDRTLAPAQVPSPEGRSRDRLRVLVVVSPGRPESDEYLTSAIEEGKALVELLSTFETVDVDVLAGDPSDDGLSGFPKQHAPATRLSVFQTLLTAKRPYDVLHYSGHAWFDGKDQTKTGWAFGGGVLTASEIGRIDVVLQLIVANACLSARTSRAMAGQRRRTAVRDFAITPGLADEYFKRGVRAYVGTAWSVEDQAAATFARRFYETLLRSPEPGKENQIRLGFSAPIGLAVLQGRTELYPTRATDGLSWAAYQHYGDPTMRLQLPGREAALQRA